MFCRTLNAMSFVSTEKIELCFSKVVCVCVCVCIYIYIVGWRSSAVLETCATSLGGEKKKAASRK
jgi:hypothetical protein